MKNIWPKIGIGLALGWVVIFGLALFAVGAALNNFYWPYVPVILGLTLFNYALRFLKWHSSLRLIGAKQVRWQDSLRIFVGGFPLALSPGKRSTSSCSLVQGRRTSTTGW